MAISKNQIKYIQSLRLKKFRQKYNNFVVEGEKMAKEVLSDPRFEIEMLFGEDTWFETFEEQRIIPTSRAFNISITELKQISNLSTPNQVLLVAKQPPVTLPDALKINEWYLYLDGIQDPGNMGTILRIADWFGMPYVFCSDQCADLFNTKVIQAAMGAFLRVQSSRMSLAEVLERYPGTTVLGADAHGKDIFKEDLGTGGIIVIGSEGKGLSKEVIKQVDQLISIPRPVTGGAESLNAGVATGIICAVLKNK